MDIFSLMGKITITYTDAVSNVEKVSQAAKDTAENLEDVDKKAEDAGESVEDAGKSAKDANSGFSVWKATLANLASTAITSLISKCAELAGKMVEVTKSAVGHYAEYEQLVGGVETLFGTGGKSVEEYAASICSSVENVKKFQRENGLAVDGIVGKMTSAAIHDKYKSLMQAQTTVMNNANKAYKTAGMSANNYMETATSFAASLIQGLGGDTEKAVKLTDLAITDMSDNANKMGTDIESIQNAYQGFAKQNYTMLDNLKLGYGGTQSEMVRLINDSGILNEKIENLDGITFDQMIEAIHKIQDNLGITGTTALEAGTTISGSWGSIQALFENILTKVGSKLAPTVMGFLQKLSDWMETVDWDAFASSVGDALQPIFDWIQQIDFTTFFEKGMDGVGKFLKVLSGLIKSVPKIIQTWSPLIAGVTAAFWLFNAALNANPIVLLVTLIAGLVVALITLWNTNDGFREAVTGAWEKIKEVFGNVIEAIKGFFSGLVVNVQTVWTSIKSIISAGIEAIKGFFTNIINFVKNNWQGLLLFIVNPFAGAFKLLYDNCEGFRNFIDTTLSAIKRTFTNIWNGIKSVISNVLSAISSIISAVWGKIATSLSLILQRIKKTFTNIWNTIKSTISIAVNAIKTTVSNVWNAISSIISNTMNRIKTTVSSIWNVNAK